MRVCFKCQVINLCFDSQKEGTRSTTQPSAREGWNPASPSLVWRQVEICSVFFFYMYQRPVVSKAVGRWIISLELEVFLQGSCPLKKHNI